VLAREIEQLERRGWGALSGPNGAAFYADVMADDGLMVFPRLILDKRRTLAAIEAEAPWDGFDLSDIRVVEATPDAATIVYRAVARRGRFVYRANMSSAYARRDGRWQLVLHQQSADP